MTFSDRAIAWVVGVRHAVKRWALRVRWRGALTIGEGARVGTARFVSISGAGSIAIGPHAVISPNSVITADGGSIVIGERCFVNVGCVVGSRTTVSIGPDVAIGPNVVVVDTNKDQEARVRGAERNDVSQPIAIHRGVWIGANAVVLGGVTIGTGATVGAGSVVTRDVAPGQTVGGVPARPLT